MSRDVTILDHAVLGIIAVIAEQTDERLRKLSADCPSGGLQSEHAAQRMALAPTSLPFQSAYYRQRIGLAGCGRTRFEMIKWKSLAKQSKAGLMSL